jgi:hypothetical protein
VSKKVDPGLIIRGRVMGLLSPWGQEKFPWAGKNQPGWGIHSRVGHSFALDGPVGGVHTGKD